MSFISSLSQGNLAFTTRSFQVFGAQLPVKIHHQMLSRWHWFSLLQKKKADFCFGGQVQHVKFVLTVSGTNIISEVKLDLNEDLMYLIWVQIFQRYFFFFFPQCHSVLNVPKPALFSHHRLQSKCWQCAFSANRGYVETLHFFMLQSFLRFLSCYHHAGALLTSCETKSTQTWL